MAPHSGFGSSTDGSGSLLPYLVRDHMIAQPAAQKIISCKWVVFLHPSRPLYLRGGKSHFHSHHHMGRPRISSGSGGGGSHSLGHRLRSALGRDSGPAGSRQGPEGILLPPQNPSPLFLSALGDSEMLFYSEVLMGSF